MEPNTQSQSEIKKKSSAGIIGFTLGIAGLFTFGLIAIPGLFFCMIGIVRKANRILAYIGLVLCLFGILLLSTFTPPGTVPYPLSIAKYCMNAPSFWIIYDIKDIHSAQSQYWFFGGAGGTLYFKSEMAGRFEPNEIICFAGKHKWRFKETKQFSQKEISELVDTNGSIKHFDFNLYCNTHEQATTEEIAKIMERNSQFKSMTMIFSFWIKDDCTILFFETGNLQPSQVVINKDGSEMAVYANGVR